ncbi:MAG TPA: hypothetical protein VEC06_05330 [Paucimonas sp.]|nr:hypothetical protein [Paucimonas sp.]
MESGNNQDLLAGLRALAESAFPKRCANCGREFASVEQFINETRQVRQGVSGLKQGLDDDDKAIVEVFRNCPCGSTLMDVFRDRRDPSAAGMRRREKFAELVELLRTKGVASDVAHAELKKVLHGERSELLDGLLGSPGFSGQ